MPVFQIEGCAFAVPTASISSAVTAAQWRNREDIFDVSCGRGACATEPAVSFITIPESERWPVNGSGEAKA